MPEAIATSKRKFHKLLDSITASSHPPPGSILKDNAPLNGPGSVATLTAREKMDIASERARKRIRGSTSTTSLSTTLGPNFTLNHNSSTTSLARKPSSTKTAKANTDAGKEPPNFSPWSQDMFLARLKTFSRVSLWHPKPDVIGEVQWAKRGWRCVDVNTVACKGGCERRVVVKLDTTGKVVKDTLANETTEEDQDEEELNETALEHALAERYRDEIVEGHAENCLWRKAICKDDIYRLSLVRPVVWQPELRKRFTSLLDISTSIKNVTFKSLDRSDATLLPPQRLLAELPKEVIDTPDEHTELKAKALDIALHGWRGSSESSADLLHCDACFQRIGLWMYQPGYKLSRRATSEEPDAGEDDSIAIDLLEMHRDHCPWRNATTQKGTGSLSGMNACEILNRVVSTYTREQRRRSDEQAAALRESAEDAEEGEGEKVAEVPKLSREEVDRLDKEREGKLRRLKKMFTIKRSSKASVG